MTELTKPLKRVTRSKLDGSYGLDRNRRIVVSLIPGDGDQIHDLIELRPERTRRSERIAVVDVYRYAIRCRANLAFLEKARRAKERKAQRLADLREKRALKKMTRRPA